MQSSGCLCMHSCCQVHETGQTEGLNSAVAKLYFNDTFA